MAKQGSAKTKTAISRKPCHLCVFESRPGDSGDRNILYVRHAARSQTSCTEGRSLWVGKLLLLLLATTNSGLVYRTIEEHERDTSIMNGKPNSVVAHWVF